MPFFNVFKQWFLTDFKNKPIIWYLIGINVLFYVLIVFLDIVFLSFSSQLASHFAENWLYVPSTFSVFINRFYTVLTYQFLHYNLFHLLSNMVILYYFGTHFSFLSSSKKIVPLYILGGIMGAIVFLVAFYFQDDAIKLVGASGSVMALLAAVATLQPKYKVHLFGTFFISYQWIAYFFVIINLLTIQQENAAGNYAHLGGLFFGYVFVKASENGIDLSQFILAFFNSFWSIFKRDKKLKVTHISEKFKQKKTFISNQTSNINTEETQEKMNAILDKIKMHGYDKLNQSEKAFLFKHAKK